MFMVGQGIRNPLHDFVLPTSSLSLFVSLDQSSSELSSLCSGQTTETTDLTLHWEGFAIEMLITETGKSENCCLLIEKILPLLLGKACRL